MKCHVDLQIVTNHLEEHIVSIFMVRQSKKGTGDCLTLKMEALLSSETLATIYQLRQHDILENLNTFGFSC